MLCGCTQFGRIGIYLSSFFGLMDMLSIFPSYFQLALVASGYHFDSTIFRVFRLVRIFELEHFLEVSALYLPRRKALVVYFVRFPRRCKALSFVHFVVYVTLFVCLVSLTRVLHACSRSTSPPPARAHQAVTLLDDAFRR
jgi:hypothetical protein